MPSLNDARAPARDAAALAVCLALAFALRAVGLGDVSYSLDESYNAWAVRGLDRYLSAFVVDHHPPVWYALVALWSRVAGDGDIALRLLSVTAGVGLVPAVWSIARRIGGRGAGIVAAALAACWPLLVIEQRELYMYAWLPLGAAITIQALLRASERDRPRDWAIAGIAAALFAGLHFFGALCAAGMLLGAWWSRRSRGPVFAMSVAFVAYLPVIGLLTQVSPSVIPGESRGLGPGAYLRLATGLILGERPDADPLPLLIVAVIVLSLGAFGLAASRGARGVLVGALIAGVAVPVVVSAVAIEYPLTPRYFISVVPVLIVGVALAVAALPRGAIAAVGAGLSGVLLIASLQLVSVQAALATDWRGLAAAIGARTTSERVIWVSPTYHELALGRYYQGPLGILGIPERALAAHLRSSAGPAWLVLRRDLADLRPAASEELVFDTTLVRAYRLAAPTR